MLARFTDRAAAGRALAVAVADAVEGDAVVLGLPNGGLAVAAPIAKALGVPLGVAWVAKLALPREPGVVLGALDLDGDVTLNPEALRAEAVDGETLTELAYHARERLRARVVGVTPELARRTVVVVDDGLTTGVSLSCALRWARGRGAARLVVAVPVVDARIWSRVSEDADQAVTLEIRPDGPIARSEIYEAYQRVGNHEIERLLSGRRARARKASVATER
jgi:predicted phosphoribosyltransferase